MKSGRGGGNFWEIWWRGKSSGLEFQGPLFSSQLSQNSLRALRQSTSILWVLDLLQVRRVPPVPVFYGYVFVFIHQYTIPLKTLHVLSLKVPITEYNKQSDFSFIYWETLWERGERAGHWDFQWIFTGLDILNTWSCEHRRWGNWGSERLSNSHEVMKPGSNRAGVCAQAWLTPKLVPDHHVAWRKGALRGPERSSLLN